MPEDLSPADANALRLGKLLLGKNPDIANRAKRLAREADPTLRVPELELEDKIEAGIKTANERADKLEQDLLKERVARRQEEQRKLSEAAGLSHDDVEKIVVEEKCSHATARKLLLAQAQSAEPSAGEVSSGGRVPGRPIDIRPEKDVRKLSGNGLRQWSSDLAHSMVDGFAKMRRQGAR